MNNALSGVAEIVAGPAAMLILQRFGRRTSTCITMVVAGSMTIISSLSNEFSNGTFC